MKKVVFINIFRNSEGGGEVYLKRLINTLTLDKTIDPILLSPEAPALENTACKKINITGIEINRHFPSLKELYLTVKQIRNNLKVISPDLIIINGDRAIMLSPLFILNYKAIGIKHMLIKSRLKSILNSIAFSKLAKIITISNFHKKNYCHWFKKQSIHQKIEVIYNAVDTSYFKVHKTTNSTIKFIEIASIDNRKGQKDLILAFANLKSKTDKPIELHLVGSGPLLEKYRDMVKMLKLDDVVFFHGYQKNVKRFFEDSGSVFILPSYDEGLPISILEAMSCETPVISTK